MRRFHIQIDLDKASHFLCDSVLHQRMGLTVPRGKCCKNSVMVFDVYCKYL